MSSGTLFVVATPIGNLDDITIRAVETLRNADLIACEDTRKTRTLLKRLNIRTRMMSLHRFTERKKTGAILERLERGLDVALVSDAGTPGISDPGHRLVKAARAAGFSVVPIPGPSSVTAALSVSGLECSSFVFMGFAPKKQERRRAFLEEIADQARPTVFFETPHRIESTLGAAQATLGRRNLVLMRELTKIHEEVITGDATAILDQLARRSATKGEIVIIVEPASPPGDETDIEAVVQALMDEGLTGSRLAEEARDKFGVKKRDAYNAFLALKDRDPDE